MEVCCEFSRKVFLNQIQKKPFLTEIEADEKEKKALSKRFFLSAIPLLSCFYKLSYFHGGHIRVEGKLKATVIQNCVLSLEDFSVDIKEDFELLLVPAHQLGKELEALEDPDVIAYEGDRIDIGEITAQQLALLLDPYPHKPGADRNGILQEEHNTEIPEKNEKENPFRILKTMKRT